MIYHNTDAVIIVNEYIHSKRDRSIILDRLVDGLSIEELAAKYDRSTRAMQRKVAKLQSEVFLHMK